VDRAVKVAKQGPRVVVGLGHKVNSRARQARHPRALPAKAKVHRVVIAAAIIGEVIIVVAIADRARVNVAVVHREEIVPLPDKTNPLATTLPRIVVRHPAREVRRHRVLVLRCSKVAISVLHSVWGAVTDEITTHLE
jgi:hypothetical protein